MPYKRYARRRTYRQGFKAKRSRYGGLSVYRPHGSIYDNDCYTTIQWTGDVKRDQGQAFLQMRNDIAVTIRNIATHVDQPEFTAIAPRYSYYEIRGMKMEITPLFFTTGQQALSVGTTRIWAGAGVNVNTTGPVLPQDLEPLSQQATAKATNGTCKLYFAVLKEMKNIGCQWGISTGSIYTLQNSSILYGYVPTQGFVDGENVASATCTWYIRFHTRKSL